MSNSTPFSVLVLAGRRNGADPVAQERGVTHKAIAKVGGRPMIENVLGALAGSTWADKTYISIEDVDMLGNEINLKDFPHVCHVAASAGSICRSIQKMVADSTLKPPFVVVTADHALLTPGMFDHFAKAAHDLSETGKDFALAMVSETAFRQNYPDARRTFLSFRDDNFSSCNMFAFLTPESLSVLDFWANVEKERKKPWKIVRMFGIFNLVRYLLRLYDLDGMIEKGGEVLNLSVTAIKMPFPEAAIDVDTVQDLFLVENILASRATTA